MAVANDAIFVMPQVEDMATVEDIDAYLDVPGIDAVCVGPNDMSGTAGVLRQLDHPTVVAAVDRVYAAARARKLPVCLGISQPAEAMPALVEAGVRMPIATADLELVAKGAATALAAAKRALGAS